MLILNRKFRKPMTLFIALMLAISHVQATDHPGCYKLSWTQDNLWKEAQQITIQEKGLSILKNNSGKSTIMNLFDPNISRAQCKKYTLDISKSTSTYKKYIDVEIVNYETEDYKNTGPRVKLIISVLFETMVYQDKENGKTEQLDIKGQIYWNEENHVDEFSAFMDKSTGTVMFEQDSKIIGKSFQNDFFKSGFTYLQHALYIKGQLITSSSHYDAMMHGGIAHTCLIEKQTVLEKLTDMTALKATCDSDLTVSKGLGVICNKNLVSSNDNLETSNKNLANTDKEKKQCQANLLKVTNTNDQCQQLVKETQKDLSSSQVEVLQKLNTCKVNLEKENKEKTQSQNQLSIVTTKNDECQKLVKETQKDMSDSKVEVLAQLNTCNKNLVNSKNNLVNSDKENLDFQNKLYVVTNTNDKCQQLVKETQKDMSSSTVQQLQELNTCKFDLEKQNKQQTQSQNQLQLVTSKNDECQQLVKETQKNSQVEVFQQLNTCQLNLVNSNNALTIAQANNALSIAQANNALSISQAREPCKECTQQPVKKCTPNDNANADSSQSKKQPVVIEEKKQQQNNQVQDKPKPSSSTSSTPSSSSTATESSSSTKAQVVVPVVEENTGSTTEKSLTQESSTSKQDTAITLLIIFLLLSVVSNIVIGIMYRNLNNENRDLKNKNKYKEIQRSSSSVVNDIEFSPRNQPYQTQFSPRSDSGKQRFSITSQNPKEIRRARTSRSDRSPSKSNKDDQVFINTLLIYFLYVVASWKDIIKSNDQFCFFIGLNRLYRKINKIEVKNEIDGIRILKKEFDKMISQAPYTLDLKNVTIDFNKNDYIKKFQTEIITDLIMNESSNTSLTGAGSKSVSMSNDRPGIAMKNKYNVTPNGKRDPSGTTTPAQNKKANTSQSQPNEPSSFKDPYYHNRNISQKKLMGGDDDAINITEESYLELDNVDEK